MHKAGVPFRSRIKLFCISAMLIAVLALVVGCASATPEPVATAAPTEAAEPTPTLAPKPTLAPTETPSPTATPLPTPTPVPTATHLPTPTPVPTATPIPTPTPIPNTPPIITNPGDKTYEQGESITRFNITVIDKGDSPTVTVSGLPDGLSYRSGRVSGTIDSNATAKDYAVTISADDGVSAIVSATFTIAVTPNNPPVITNPGNKSYKQGETITPFSVTVVDAEDTPTVTLSGLPSSLSYNSSEVSGIIDSSISAEDYLVTISTHDGVNPVVSTTFTITVTPNTPPVITNPGNKSYDQGELISAFDITVIDAEDTPTVTLKGSLPFGLSYSSGRVSGTVASYALALTYEITIHASDGSLSAIPVTFTITVNRAVTSSETCEDDWLIDEIVELSEESSNSRRILKLYKDTITEVERTTRLLRCRAAAKFSWGGDRYLTYHYEIDRDGDGFIGYRIGESLP